MRLTTLMFVIVLAHVSTMAHAQITLKEKDAPLEKVLAAIEKQTKFVFLYDPDAIRTAPITISIKNATVEQTLAQLFHNLPIEYSVVDHNILLKAKLVTTTTAANYFSIHGRVVDSTGQPLPGVTVFSKRDKKTTTTDTAGFYSIRGGQGDQLVFTSVGYKDRTILIAGQPSINLTLELNPSIPDQVVVIGYGTSKKKDLTGAISVVNVSDMGQTAYNTFDNALAGKAAGVDVTKTDGTPGGMVRIRIRGSSSLLAGNDPLYVIDGIPLQIRSNYIAPGFNVASPVGDLVGAGPGLGIGAALSASFVNGLNSLSGVNPDDIASITILKDASSMAIYGSKAANGVVIITTKTGKTNMPAQVEVSYSTTLNAAYKTPHLLNASQYKTLITEAAQNDSAANSSGGTGGGIIGLGPSLDPVASAVLDSPAYFGTANTNWIKQVTRTTVSNNAGVSVSGGGQGSKYFSSIAYSNTPGVVKGTDYQRISGKLNLETQIGSKLRVATNLLLASTSQDIGDGAYAQALLARPDLTPRDALGNYTNFDFQSHASDPKFGLINPAALVTATNNARTLGLLGSVSGVYDLSKTLHFRTAVSLNMQHYNQRNYLPGYIDTNQLYSGNVADPGGIGSDANSQFADWFLENTFSYNKQFNDNNAINVVVGQSYETTKYSYFTTTVAGYPNDNNLTSLSSGNSVVSVGGDDPRSPQSYLLSFYSRANYSYQDKYLFTFTGRADGSSKFGPTNKYGYFPSGAIAWRASHENFLKNAGWITDLKLRISYGLTGNQNIGDQVYRTLYTPTSYAGSSALIPSQLGNSGIKWEATKEADIGLDMGLLNGRLTASFDWYHRQTGDALLSLPVPPSTTYSTLLQNVVGLRNSGFEATIGADIIRARDFKWTAAINATWNASLITRLNAQADLTQIVSQSGLESVGRYTLSSGIPVGNTTLIEGKPLGLITGYSITGIIKTPAALSAYLQQLGTARYSNPQIGDAMFKLDPSTASQGYENPEQNVIIGNGAPKYFGGMTQEFSYKNFGLHCNFTFSQGGHLLWAEHVASGEFFNTANADVSMLNRYTAANPNSNQPRLRIDPTNIGAYIRSNLDVFSSSYIKLRSLTFDYNFNRAGWMKRAEIKTCTVFISATNVFTITKYPGSDPEASDDPYSVTGGYIDAGNYPATRSFSFGLKAAF